MKEVAMESDMSGTIFICIMFGLLLMLKGKIKFGNIYGFGLTGCAALWMLINLLMKKGHSIDLYNTISVLGYSLLPFVLLAVVNLF